MESKLKSTTKNTKNRTFELSSQKNIDQTSHKTLIIMPRACKSIFNCFLLMFFFPFSKNVNFSNTLCLKTNFQTHKITLFLLADLVLPGDAPKKEISKRRAAVAELPPPADDAPYTWVASFFGFCVCVGCSSGRQCAERGAGARADRAQGRVSSLSRFARCANSPSRVCRCAGKAIACALSLVSLGSTYQSQQPKTKAPNVLKELRLTGK